jgi:uncharacterized membrane protein
MNPLRKLGSALFAIPIIFFGIQYLRARSYVGGLPPVPPWAPGGAIGADLTGGLLIAGGASILFGKRARVGAALIGWFFLLCVIVLHLTRWHHFLYDGVDRTRALEPLALSGAAFALISILPSRGVLPRSPGGLTRVGCWLFALSLIVFGYQHYLYATFIATLIPAWIPVHLFWVYFTGVGFVVTGLAILVEKYRARLAATWLGIMFLLWFVLLHIPRAVTKNTRDEWNSAFVALAMAGASFIIARALPGEESSASIRWRLR